MLRLWTNCCAVWYRLRWWTTWMLLIGIGAVGTGSVADVRAQVNTERMRKMDVDGVRFQVGGDVAFQSGNADLIEVGTSARVDYRSARNYTFLVSEVRYGEEDGEAFRDRAFAHLRYNRQLTSWLVGEAFTQVQQDGFKLLRLRTLVGSGIRIRYVDEARVKVFQGTTPMYEYETLDSETLVRHPATVSTVRWSNYVNVRVLLTEKTRILSTVYVQPRVDRFEDVRVLNETTLAVALSKHVTLQVRFDLDYDSRPPDEVEDLDVALTNGITVSF